MKRSLEPKWQPSVKAAACARSARFCHNPGPVSPSLAPVSAPLLPARLLVVGLGAIGMKYAARLQAIVPERLQVLADARRIAGFRADPPQVNGQRQDFRFVEPGRADGPVDLVLVAVKAAQLCQAIADLDGFVGPDTRVMSLLNGLDSEDILAAAFGHPERVLYANVYMDAVRQGHAVYYRDIGRIVFGERDNRVPSPAVRAIAALFDQAGIPCEVPADMLHAHWAKFMLNVGINQTSAVLRAPYGVFQREPHARALMLAAAREVVALSQAAGTGLDEADVERLLTTVDRLAPQAKTSMLQDIEAGRETEVDLFAGTVIALGRRHGVPTPVNQTLFDLIKALQAQHRPADIQERR